MCYITATELKNNLMKYMELSLTEDVIVTKNGNVLTMLTNPKDKALLNFLKLRDEIKNVDQISDEDALLEALESR